MNSISLRRAHWEDSRQLWMWRNAPDVRAMAFDVHEIPWERHQEWFARKLTDPACLLYIAEDQAGAAIGQVRFDMSAEMTEAEISIALHSASRGRGLGTAMIRQGLVAACDAANTLATVHAYIKPGNIASRRAFSRAGFIPGDLNEVRGVRAEHLVWHRDSMGISRDPDWN